jgi:protein-S-isoprenylcysteine O-methyltransferase Ste14
MANKMTIWGVGPKFTLFSFTSFTIILTINYLVKDFFAINLIPETVLLSISFVLLIIGVPFFIISATTISKVYKYNKLYTLGVYATCRHPLYSSFIFFIAPGIVMFFKSWLLLIVPFLMFFIFKTLIKKEENYLKNEYKEDYIEYKKSVNLVFPLLWRIFLQKKN